MFSDLDIFYTLTAVPTINDINIKVGMTRILVLFSMNDNNNIDLSW